MKVKKINLFLISLSLLLIVGCGYSQEFSSSSDTSSFYEVKENFENVTFTSRTILYDGEEHTILVEGAPSDAIVTYYNNGPFVDVGKYDMSVKVSKEGYNDLNLYASLTISAQPIKRNLKASGSTVFFQNALDNDYLYVYDGNSIMRANSDTAVDMISIGEDQIAYVNKSSSFSSVKELAYSSSEVASEVQFSANAEYIQKVDENIYYYAINSESNEDSGIYKADLTNEEPIISLVSKGNAHYLQLDLENNCLYFADGNNENRLSKINLDSNERILLVDEKINNLLLNNGVLYYTVDNLLGDYIEKYVIEINNRVKLTIDAGDSLTVVGDYLYYINVDKFTNLFVGKGIYKVPLNAIVDSTKVGTKVVESESGVYSLTSDGQYLYYYEVDGDKLMKFDLSTENEENILNEFVKPGDFAPLSFGGKLETYGDYVYYLNIHDGKTLHRYNTINKVDQRVTSEKVVDFSIIGNKLYINVVSYLVNNDTYVIDLENGGEPQKVNPYSSRDICSDGTYIYYIEENALGVATSIHRANFDGTNDMVIYNYGVSNLRYVNNQLLFVDSYNIRSLNLSTLAYSEIKVNGKNIHTTVFDTDGTYIYYREMYGFLWTSKRLSKCTLDGNNYSRMVTEDTDPIMIRYIEGNVYYYCDTLKAKNNGLFKVSSNSNNLSVGSLVLACNSTYYAETICYNNGKIYFLNYATAGLFGNSRIYSIDINDGLLEFVI